MCHKKNLIFKLSRLEYCSPIVIVTAVNKAQRKNHEVEQENGQNMLKGYVAKLEGPVKELKTKKRKRRTGPFYSRITASFWRVLPPHSKKIYCRSK